MLHALVPPHEAEIRASHNPAPATLEATFVLIALSECISHQIRRNRLSDPTPHPLSPFLGLHVRAVPRRTPGHLNGPQSRPFPLIQRRITALVQTLCSTGIAAPVPGDVALPTSLCTPQCFQCGAKKPPRCHHPLSTPDDTVTCECQRRRAVRTSMKSQIAKHQKQLPTPLLSSPAIGLVQRGSTSGSWLQ